MALALLALSALGRLTSASVTSPQDVEVLSPRQSLADLSPVYDRSLAQIEKRALETFDLGWSARDEALFSANWTGGTGDIPIGLTPFKTSLADSFSLVLECLDCRTFGNIDAEFTNDDGLKATLTFNSVGAYMDFGVFSSNEGTFTIGLGRFFGTKNLTGHLFSADIGFGIDLVLQFSGEVQASAGFQMAIPDGEQVGIDIDFDVDLDNLIDPDIDVSANINLFPHVDFSLLPVELSDAAANITAALVLKTEAGVGVEVADVGAEAKVGAHLTLVEVSFGAVLATNSTCEKALFVDIETNAGAFAQAGAKVPGHEFEVGPDVSTVFASAGTTTCLGAKSPTFRSTRTSDPVTASGAGGCPAALTTKTSDVTRTASLTSCVVSAVNCPESLTQVVVVTHIEKASTIFCPVNVTAVPTGGVFISASATTTSASVTAMPFSQGAITIPPLTEPVTASVPPSFANVTAPVNATVTGIFETVSVPTRTLTATPSINIGGGSDSGDGLENSAGTGPNVMSGAGWVTTALLGVALWAAVLL